MGYKDDNYSTRVCGHHPETCTCRDWDTKRQAERTYTEAEIQLVLDGFTNEAPGQYIKTNFIDLLKKQK